MKLSEKNIKTVVNVLKYLYLVTSIVLLLLILAIIYLLNFGSPAKTPSPLISIIFQIPGLIMCFAFYWGLKTKQPWLVPIMVVLNSLHLVYLMLTFPQDIIHVIAKIIGLCLAAFNIYFFTTKEVKKYFKSKGLYLFGK